MFQKPMIDRGVKDIVVADVEEQSVLAAKIMRKSKDRVDGY